MRRKEVPLKAVQVEALVRILTLWTLTGTSPSIRGLIYIGTQVAMKIIKHCAQTFPSSATGFIVGLDVEGVMQITNSFPFPGAEIPNPDAPRAKANTIYQNEMIKYLREVNVDGNHVGWYTSANMGNFVTANMIENQYFYQKELNERTVALVHDISRSSQGGLSLRAFRLSPAFMAQYKEGKFSTERWV